MFNRKAAVSIIVALVLSTGAFVLPSNASTSPSLPATTSYASKGLNEMLRVTGRLYVSLDGLGTGSGTGNIQVEKPSAGAKVVGAYLSIGQRGLLSSAPTNLTLNAQTVAFTHDTVGALGGKNYLADVTSLVKSTIDAASAGILDLAVDEGTANNSIEGTSLLVIFDDPESVWGSLIFMFGSSDTTGDNFEVSFPALESNELSGHWMSLGISYGFQNGDLQQASTLTLTTSSVASPATLSQIAGGADDASGTATNGNLITVGGIGDSIENNPGTSTTYVSPHRTDDELYGLEDYLSAGDTSITLNSRNPSNDDDIFQAVLFLKRVQIQDAVVVDDPEVTALLGAPVNSSAGRSSAAEPTSPTAPVLPRLDNFNIATGENGLPQLRIEGKRLWCISSMTIDGINIPLTTGFSTPWYEYLNADISGVTPGKKTLVFQSCMGEVTYTNWLNISSPVEPKSMWAKVSTFVLGEGTKAKIAAFNSNLGEGYKKIRCIVNSANGEDLNEAFAKQICAFAQSNDLQQAEVVHETKVTFTGKGYWVNIWSSGG